MRLPAALARARSHLPLNAAATWSRSRTSAAETLAGATLRRTSRISTPAIVPTLATPRSHVSSAMPMATSTTPMTSDMTRPTSSWRASGGPNSRAGSASTGRVSSTPVVIRPVAERTAPTVAGAWPDWMSMRPWITAPVAAPPGMIRLAALPASWLVDTSTQPEPGSAMRSSSHRLAKLSPSSTTTTTNHHGSTSPSEGHAANTVSRLGATTYRPMPQMIRAAARVPTLRNALEATGTLSHPRAGLRTRNPRPGQMSRPAAYVVRAARRPRRGQVAQQLVPATGQQAGAVAVGLVPRGGAQPVAQLRVVHDPCEGSREGRHVSLGHEQAVDAVLDQVARAGRAVEADHRQPAAHRLEHR